MVPSPLRESVEKQFMKTDHKYILNPPVKSYETSLLPLKGQN